MHECSYLLSSYRLTPHRFVVAQCVASKMNPPHLFNEFMAKPLLDSARLVMRESKVDTFEEFISTDALLTKVGKD
jgi:hypothetical protein